MKQKNERKKNGGGRIPLADPAKNRHVFYLNDADNIRFTTLYHQSEAKTMAQFITSCIFSNPVRVVRIDKGLHDYYMRLTTFFDQFRMIGHNYNQLIKLLHSNFGEKKALAFLYKLEQATIELAGLNRKIIELTHEFEQKHLQNGSQN
ncbi:conjugal transfer protein MobA [Dysgonomonas macrotermitis]|uniref:conjugal transfer protein MobA n=1 Tax=Dysgonomonas macrotermitis TaxID=1346286 RepID=UPI000785ECCC|nr:conjugal transfer protein MobA [Dysgonomonas macrotermitis]